MDTNCPQIKAIHPSIYLSTYTSTHLHIHTLAIHTLPIRTLPIRTSIHSHINHLPINAGCLWRGLHHCAVRVWSGVRIRFRLLRMHRVWQPAWRWCIETGQIKLLWCNQGIDTLRIHCIFYCTSVFRTIFCMGMFSILLWGFRPFADKSYRNALN